MIQHPVETSIWDFVISVFTIGIIIAAGFMAADYLHLGGSAARFKQESAQARSLWLSECKADGRRLDDCLRAWEDLMTLREMYIERVKP